MWNSFEATNSRYITKQQTLVPERYTVNNNSITTEVESGVQLHSAILETEYGLATVL